MSVIHCLINQRNFICPPKKKGQEKNRFTLSIAGAKEDAECPVGERTDIKALKYIKKRIQEEEASLFVENTIYKRIVELEHYYDMINSKRLKDNEKGAQTRLLKSRAKSSKKKQKKSHESSENAKNSDLSLIEASAVIEINQNFSDEISLMQSYCKNFEEILDQVISHDESRP